MKTILITAAFFTAPMVGSVSAQSSDVLKRQIAEQNRQISALEKQVGSLQSQLNLERKRSGKKPLPVKTSSSATSKRYHVVKPGETFSSIARKTGVSLASLIAANKGVSPTKLAIKQKLVIPQRGATTKVKPTTPTTRKVNKKTKPLAKKMHTVQKGDTFYAIARKNNTTVAKLVAMNPSINPSKITPGQKLQLTQSSKIRVASNRKKTPVNKRPKKTAVKTKPATEPSKPSKSATKPSSSASQAAPEAQPAENVESAPIAKIVTVNKIMTFEQFAKKNGTTVSVLNALNGLSLPANEPMPVGSALYVPIK